MRRRNHGNKEASPSVTLTKKRLIQSVQGRTGLPSARCSHIVESLLETIKGRIERGEEISIRGFGKIRVRGGQGSGSGSGGFTAKNAGPVKKRITFKCSKVFRDRLNRVK